jgi:hypothetical protein
VTPNETANARGGDQNRFSKLSLGYPILMSCTLERADAPEVEADKVERFYESTIRNMKDSSAPHIGICEFSAGQKFKDTKVLEIQATYYIFFIMMETS